MKTTAEAAVILGVNASRVRQLLIAGQLRGRKLGRDWLIDPEELRRYQSVPVGRPRQKRGRSRTQKQ